MARTQEELDALIALPLDLKIELTKQRIREWVERYGINGVCVSFSGGKDSTVLLDIARSMYGNDIAAVFSDTGLEYPELRKFVKQFENVDVIKPEQSFVDVISQYGYPVISKECAETVSGARIGLARHDGTYQYAIDKIYENGRYARVNGIKNRYALPKYKPLLSVDFNISPRCCHISKKNPMKKYYKQTGRKAIIGTMTEESANRRTDWLLHGCNAFDTGIARSKPMSFWTEQDVLQYIKEKNLTIVSVYGDIVERKDKKNKCKLCTTGCDRTGCIYCGFGLHLEKGETRFQKLKVTHPKQWAYCLNGGGYDMDGLWKPTKDGLGMRHVFDVLNELYGQDYIRYE